MKPLSLDVLKNKKHTIITSGEALKDVVPIKWGNLKEINKQLIKDKYFNPQKGAKL